MPEVVAHSGARAPAVVVAASAEMPAAVAGAALVGVDEGQFFDGGLVEVASSLAAGGARVVVAALDRDFRAGRSPSAEGWSSAPTGSTC